MEHSDEHARDVAEIDALIAAFYAAFDNRTSPKTVGSQLYAMFADAATITCVTQTSVKRYSPETFVAPRSAMLTDGTLVNFHEWETDSRTDVLGDIANRWSTYRKSGTLDGNDYRGGGRKLFQLYRRDARWAIASVLWEDDA